MKVQVNDAQRGMNKAVHRVDEKICDALDKSCLAKKTKNRAQETKQYAKDKIEQGSNIISNDKK